MALPRWVMKFGGTSVGDAACVRAAGAIVSGHHERSPAVVVSAASGVTDELIRLLAHAARGGSQQQAGLASLVARHRTLLRELELPAELLDSLFGELQELLEGVAVLRELTDRTRDRGLSYGERLLAPVFAAHLVRLGYDARPWDAGELGLITDDRHGRARPLAEAYARIPKTLTRAGAHIPVITGFIGRTASGETTTLGRGGSDYSASIVARAVGAEVLQIWTDVDGIMTADPRIVAGAQVLSTLSYGEASELAYSGAKVLHPSTIAPAMEAGIPVLVLNSRQPHLTGTMILGEPAPAPEGVVRSIAHKRGVQVVTVVSPRMLDRHGFLSRIAEAFNRHAVSIDMISTSEVSVSLTTSEGEHELAPVLAELEGFSAVTLTRDRGMISVVGAGLGSTSEIIANLLQSVAAIGAQVEMISYGATRLNFSFLVADREVDRVVRELHSVCFGSA
ncbi:MAG: aspartate kinase [Planctomycetota bacterium]